MISSAAFSEWFEGEGRHSVWRASKCFVVFKATKQEGTHLICEDRGDVLLGARDVLGENVDGNHVLLLTWRLIEAHRHEVLRKPAVQLLAGLVQNQMDEVKTRQDCRDEVQVGDDTLGCIVARVDGVGGRQNGGPRIQSTHNPGLCVLCIFVDTRARLCEQLLVSQKQEQRTPCGSA